MRRLVERESTIGNIVIDAKGIESYHQDITGENNVIHIVIDVKSMESILLAKAKGKRSFMDIHIN